MIILKQQHQGSEEQSKQSINEIVLKQIQQQQALTILINYKTQDRWLQIKELVKIEAKSTHQINELRNELEKHLYFQILFGFFARTFPCFEFINIVLLLFYVYGNYEYLYFIKQFIQLFKIADIQNKNESNENDLIIKVSSGEDIQQITEKSFLDEFNWNRELKKQKKLNGNDSTSMSQQLFTDQQRDNSSQFNEQNGKLIFIQISQYDFQQELKKYEMNRNLIITNITRCIPLASQIKSTRLQDIIIKNIQIVNVIEDTVINDIDGNQQSQSPRMKYLKKNIHPFAIWFLIHGNGTIEKKINENTKISISLLSEGSLFGEEILFINNNSVEVEPNNQNNSLLQQKEQLNNFNFEQFSLRLNSKVSTLYCIPKDKFLYSFPQIILHDVKKNFTDKIKSREELLKQKLNHLQTEIKETPQQNSPLKVIKQVFSYDEQSQKINLKKQQSEVILLTNRIITEKQIEKEDKNHQIQLQQSLKKDFDKQLLRKQEILAQQQQQQEKRAHSQEIEFQNNQNTDKSIYQNAIPNAKLKISNILQKRNQEQLQEQIYNEEFNQKSQLIEEYNSYKQNESESKKCFLSQREKFVDKVPDEKKHLEKKIAQLMNKGFDFGHDDIKQDIKRDSSIRLLQIKNGIFNPKVIVQHPSIVEKYEKYIIKQQQKLKSTSIIKGLDNPSFIQNDNSISQIQQNKQLSATFYKQSSYSNMQSMGDNKLSFYLTSRNDLNDKGIILNNDSFSKNQKKIPMNILQQSTDEKSTNRGNESTPASRSVSNRKLRQSASLKRVPDSFLKMQNDGQGQFSMCQMQSQQQVDKSELDISLSKQNSFQRLNKSYKRAQSIDKIQRMSNNQNSITSLNKLRDDEASVVQDTEISCFGQKIPTLSNLSLSKQNSAQYASNLNQVPLKQFISQRSNSTNLLEERKQSLQKGVSSYEYKEQPQFFQQQSSKNKSKNSIQIDQNSQMLQKRSQSNIKLYSLANSILSNDKLTNQFTKSTQSERVKTQDNSLSPQKECSQQRFFNFIKRDFQSCAQDVQKQNIKMSGLQSFESLQNLDQNQNIQIIDENYLKHNSIQIQSNQTNKLIANQFYLDDKCEELEQHFTSDQSPIVKKEKQDFQKSKLFQIVSQKVEQQEYQSDNSSPQEYAKFIQNKNEYNVIGQRIFFKGNLLNQQLQNEQSNTCSDDSNKIKSNLTQGATHEKKISPRQQIHQNKVRMALSVKQQRFPRKSESIKSSPRTPGGINQEGIKNQQKMLFQILKPTITTSQKINNEYKQLSGYSNNLQLSNIQSIKQDKVEISQSSFRQPQSQKVNQDISLQQQSQIDIGLSNNQQNNSINKINANQIYQHQSNQQSTLTYLPNQQENQIQQQGQYKLKLKQQIEDNTINNQKVNINQHQEKKEQSTQQPNNNQQISQDFIQLNPSIKELGRAKSVGRSFPSSIRIELRDDQQKYKTSDQFNQNMNSQLHIKTQQKNINKLI